MKWHMYDVSVPAGNDGFRVCLGTITRPISIMVSVPTTLNLPTLQALYSRRDENKQTEPTTWVEFSTPGNFARIALCSIPSFYARISMSSDPPDSLPFRIRTDVPWDWHIWLRGSNKRIPLKRNINIVLAFAQRRKDMKQKNFSQRLKRIRHHRGKLILSQSKVARILGVAPPRISEWEREVRTPKPLTQETIFKRLIEARAKIIFKSKRRRMIKT